MAKKHETEAYKAGYAANYDGKGEVDNPYTEGTKEAQDWDEGFEQADYDRLGEDDEDEGE